MKINKNSKILWPAKYMLYRYRNFVAHKKMKNMENITIEKDFYKIIDEIVKEKKSIARFGDSEFRVMLGEDPGDYQKPNLELSKRLQEIIGSEENNIKIGIWYVLKDYNTYTLDAKMFFAWFISTYFDRIYPYLNPNTIYINSSFSRIYLRTQNKQEASKKFKYIKKLWDQKDIVFIEGEFSKLGVGNDLFNNAKSVRRILAPAKEAFSVYDDILKEAKKLSKDVLFILALGSTATVLAYDLSKLGYQALDLGHVDLEYEWFLREAKEPINIEGKYTNESASCSKVQGEIKDENYEQSIIARVGI